MPAQTTRDHQQIRQWAQAHGACPAVVSRTGGMLRFEFDPAQARELTEVDWEDFFSVLDRKGLELVYDDKPGSRFHKIVYPETVAAQARRQPARRPARARQRMNVLGGGSRSGREKAKATGRGAGRAKASRGGATPASGRSARATTSRATASRAKSKTGARGQRAPAARKVSGGRSGRSNPRRRAS